MIDLKALLTKILNEIHVLPTAASEYWCSTAIASSGVSANSTWYYPNSFSGWQKTAWISSTGSRYFREDTNGYTITKAGYYRIHAGCHCNGESGASSWGIQIYNYTNETQLGSSRWAYSASAWGSLSVEFIGYINTGVIVVPRFQRGGGSGAWRMTNATFNIELIEDTR